jgi:hypothetical protein
MRLPVIWAGLLLILIAVPLFAIPLPVTNLAVNLTNADHDTWAATFIRAFRPAVEFRPLLLIWIKLGFEAFGSTAWAYHALALLQYAACLGLLLRLFRPPDLKRGIAAALAITCFVGLHSSRAMFILIPVNASSAGVMLVLLAALLAIDSSTPRHDWLFLPLTACALLLLESGVVLVPLVFVLRLMKAPGLTWRGVALTVATAVGYIAIRRVGGDGFTSIYTETGLGFGTANVQELQSTFQNAVWMLWLYNSIATLFTVLFSEPRQGVYSFIHVLLEGGGRPWIWLHVLSSTLTTAAIAATLIAARPFTARDRLLIAVGAVLLVVGSGLGFLYTRDRIALTAGLGYVVLVYVAFAQLIGRTANVSAARSGSPAWHLPAVTRSYAVTALIAGLAGLWTCRAIETHFQLRDAAWEAHLEWKNQFGDTPAGPPGSVAERLRGVGLQPPADPRAEPEWTHLYFERKF